MSRRLILLRHGKSSWDQTGASDHDRVLSRRGRASCEAIGTWLANRGAVPDQVLCSDAARTRETWELLARHLPHAPEAELRRDLYLAEAGAMRAVLRTATGQTVAMIGHNPGIAELASDVVAQAPDHDGFSRYPTLATLIVDFAISDWSALGETRGQLVQFIVPRELTE